MEKGLEFDMVIVPYASAKNYKSEVDESLLYVACTRAMHQLYLTYVKEPAALIRAAIETKGIFGQTLIYHILLIG